MFRLLAVICAAITTYTKNVFAKRQPGLHALVRRCGCRGNPNPSAYISTHFHYIKWLTAHCSSQRQIIPAAPVSLVCQLDKWPVRVAVMYWLPPSAPWLPLAAHSLSLLAVCLCFFYFFILMLPSLLLYFHSSCLSISLLHLSSSAATNWVLPSSGSSNLSVHGISAVQMAGSSQFGFFCFSGSVSLFISITTLVFAELPSTRPLIHSLYTWCWRLFSAFKSVQNLLSVPFSCSSASSLCSCSLCSLTFLCSNFPLTH